jgi:transcriptional regulator GlxA family with amidase domain
MQIPTVTTIRLGDEIAAELTGVLRGWDSRRPPGLLSAKAHLLRVLVLLMKLGRDEVDGFALTSGLDAGEMRDRRRVEKALKHMEDHFSQPVEAADLARMAGLSLSHFTRLFRERTGHAPMQYLRRFRVQHARRLLGDESLSIKEIAVRCGFEDPYHFSKVFHALDGLPPTLYREALLAGK